MWPGGPRSGRWTRLPEPFLLQPAFVKRVYSYILCAEYMVNPHIRSWSWNRLLHPETTRIVLRTRGVPALNETDIRKLESIDSTCMKLSTTSDKLVKNHVISARQDHLKKESIAAVEDLVIIVRFSSSSLPGLPGYISYSVKHTRWLDGTSQLLPLSARSWRRF